MNNDNLLGRQRVESDCPASKATRFGKKGACRRQHIAGHPTGWCGASSLKAKRRNAVAIRLSAIAVLIQSARLYTHSPFRFQQQQQQRGPACCSLNPETCIILRESRAVNPRHSSTQSSTCSLDAALRGWPCSVKKSRAAGERRRGRGEGTACQGLRCETRRESQRVSQLTPRVSVSHPGVVTGRLFPGVFGRMRFRDSLLLHRLPRWPAPCQPARVSLSVWIAADGQTGSSSHRAPARPARRGIIIR